MIIDRFHNLFEGERVFIIGNGPSLSETPLYKLQSEYSFGMNRINEIYDDSDWRPSFYYLSLPPEQNRIPKYPSEYEESDVISANIEQNIPCFLDSGHRHFFGYDKNIAYIDHFRLLDNENPFDNFSIQKVQKMPIDHLQKYWSYEADKYLYTYHSMYGLLQLATYMGFSEINLLGCDLGFGYKNPHMIFESGADPYKYKGEYIRYLLKSIYTGHPIKSLINGMNYKLLNSRFKNKLINKISDVSDKSHFTSDYLQTPIYDARSHNNQIIKSHIASYRICSDMGVEIYNATYGGELEVYPRVSLEEVL